MRPDPIARLKDYLKDPVSPSWSSKGLFHMFADLDGDIKNKQQTVLPIIDEKFSNSDIKMTDYQFNFLRVITLHSIYPKTRAVFSSEDLKWLLKRFDKKPAQQRATLIAMLLNIGALSEQRKQKIQDVLKGTLGETFCVEND